MAPQSTHLSPSELSYLHTSLSSRPPIRPDSRLATDFRPLNAETGVLPNTMGSAHVGFADGREAVVGIRAEVERTARRAVHQPNSEKGQDTAMEDAATTKDYGSGSANWTSLSLSLPGLRDDDKDVVFLEEMLRETLIMRSLSRTTSPSAAALSLIDALVINHRWHWHLYIDVLLIASPNSSAGNYPLPLLSMAIHLALRDTKIPRLKSEGDEDPLAEDDWAMANTLYGRMSTGHMSGAGLLTSELQPPVTLLVMAVGENVIFDPSDIELAVADGVWAVSVGRCMSPSDSQSSVVKILGIRMLATPARDTMRGVARDTDPLDLSKVSGSTKYDLGSGTDQVIPGVWKPKVGGVKRNVVIQVMKAVVGTDGLGMGSEVLQSLDVFARSNF